MSVEKAARKEKTGYRLNKHNRVCEFLFTFLDLGDSGAIISFAKMVYIKTVS